MAARDVFHEMVKQALIQDGWCITDDPLRIRYGGVDTYIDLGAEKLIAAEKADQKIADAGPPHGINVGRRANTAFSHCHLIYRQHGCQGYGCADVRVESF